MKTLRLAAATAVLATVVLTGCGPESPSTKPTSTATPTTAAPTRTPSTTPPTTTVTTPPATPEPTVTEEAPAAAVKTGTLPNLVGMNHQLAQDTAQAAGFYGLREKDASGMERMLMLDRNWKVCRQEPAPGKHGVEITVTLYSVKNEESC